MINTWSQMKAFAISLELPKVEETTSWGNEVLKAHGKLWVWWSPYVEGALFKCDKEERDMLRQADPIQRRRQAEDACYKDLRRTPGGQTQKEIER